MVLQKSEQEQFLLALFHFLPQRSAGSVGRLSRRIEAGRMAKEFARAFYKSPKWQKCRDAYIRQRINIDGGICESCRLEQGYIVHHKVYLTEETVKDPEISLNHDNLMYVCKSCHDQFEGHGIGNKGIAPLVVFDRYGMPVGMRAAAVR